MTEQERERVRSWAKAQKEEIIRTLIRLVRIPSISRPDCREPLFGQACQDALHEMLKIGESMGLTGTCYDGYCGSLSIDGDEKERPQKYTGIWSHLDVVPVDESRWERPPFEAYYHDGLVTGRGSQDNKSGAVVGLYALKGLKDLGIRLKRPAAVYFGISEECGMQDVQYFTAHYEAPKLSLIADCGFPVCYGEKGILVVRLTAQKPSEFIVNELCAGTAHNIIPDQAVFRGSYRDHRFAAACEGKAGHAAVPQSGVNALTGLLGKLAAVAENGSGDQKILTAMTRIAGDTTGKEMGIMHQDEQLGDLTCVASMLTMEDSCWSLLLDIRFPDSADLQFITEQIERYAKTHELQMHIDSHMPAFGYAKDDAVIARLTQIYNEEANDTAQPYVLAGGTYAAIIPRAIPFGISFSDKSLIRQFYPEGHGDYHQPDESVIVDQIVKALSIYMIALAETDDIR